MKLLKRDFYKCWYNCIW